ncbi:hypothetical protein EJD97_004095 [Solanum chilense]|uniref:Uncharacterized protein n=1 Tax=Solanum chilense TaxID=4083 RepID=A0A6N2BZV2_SOLCI|nr:hypothetical protein EJD97_004095 [Solanum chilense]
MKTLIPHTDEVKDTTIDALKVKLKGVTVLTAAVKNEEDEILIKEKYTSPIVYNDGDGADVDEVLPLAIVDENPIAVDEYFAEEVNEVVVEIKEVEK